MYYINYIIIIIVLLRYGVLLGGVRLILIGIGFFRGYLNFYIEDFFWFILGGYRF